VGIGSPGDQCRRERAAPGLAITPHSRISAMSPEEIKSHLSFMPDDGRAEHKDE
jgi:hypothetical protein